MGLTFIVLGGTGIFVIKNAMSNIRMQQEMENYGYAHQSMDKIKYKNGNIAEAFRSSDGEIEKITFTRRYENQDSISYLSDDYLPTKKDFEKLKRDITNHK